MALRSLTRPVGLPLVAQVGALVGRRGVILRAADVALRRGFARLGPPATGALALGGARGE